MAVHQNGPQELAIEFDGFVDAHDVEDLAFVAYDADLNPTHAVGCVNEGDQDVLVTLASEQETHHVFLPVGLTCITARTGTLLLPQTVPVT